MCYSVSHAILTCELCQVVLSGMYRGMVGMAKWADLELDMCWKVGDMGRIGDVSQTIHNVGLW